MPGKHARLSASSAHRWIHCPGSVELSAPYVDTDESTVYAEEGTVAHELAEWKLRRALGDKRTASAAKLKKIQASPFYSGEMDEATDYYRDTVLEHFAAAGESPELMIEQQFTLTDWVPEGFGTSDAVIIGGDTIQVIDLKYGKGVKVDARGNEQLRLYGLGAASLFLDLYDFTTVRMTIIQPRLDHVSTEELPLSELLRWAEDTVRPQAKKAMGDSDEIATGDWCRWCPAKAVCRKRAEENLELARYDFQPGPALTTEEIGDILCRAEELVKWAGDIQAYALQQALAGAHYDGWKLVEGRSTRKYADDLQVAAALTGAGYDEAMLYERKLLGITAMEKLVGKKKLTEVLGDLIVKPAGKPVLVPASDKREEINTAKQAAADFAEDLPFC